MSSPHNRLPRWTGPLLGLVLLAATGLALFLWVNRPPAPPPDEEDDGLDEPPAVSVSKSFTSPYRNTRPGVRYVGDQACAKCHVKEAAPYGHHPMGRSASLPGGRAGKGAEDGLPVAFEALGARFEVERRGDKVIHREVYRAGGRTLTALEAEVAVVIGSGNQGQSFLVNRGGRVFQSPISWYSQKDAGRSVADWFFPPPAWDLSPGYHHQMIHFNRPVTAQCLFCHCHQVTPVADAVNQFREPAFAGQLTIGCERCHGPGQLHVESRLRTEIPAGEDDLNIVNPRKLSPELREAICQQCHLQGKARIERRGQSAFDYRPGLPLQDYLAIFVQPPDRADYREAVSQVEQMHLSRCFLQSSPNKKLGCTSCHDPHSRPEPAERPGYYRGRCLECHRKGAEGRARKADRQSGRTIACSLPWPQRRAIQDNCIACHMPQGDSSIIHAAVTDHRILRRPKEARREGEPGGRAPVPFFAEPHKPSSEKDRDLGLTMVKMARDPSAENVIGIIGETASPLLTQAVQLHPEDVPAWEALGFALFVRGRPQEALKALETALAKSPRREQALRDAARVALHLGQTDAAIAYSRRLLAVNPWLPASHFDLARLLAVRNRWDEVARECRAVLRLMPDLTAARQMLIDAHLRLGRTAEAQAELEVLTALQPAEADRVRRWYAEQVKRVREQK